MLAATGLVFAVVYIDASGTLSRQVDNDLREDVSALSRSIAVDGGLPIAALRGRVASYVSTQPYTATETLLFVLFDGGPPVTNHPELFGLPVPEEGETNAQQRVENAAGARLKRPLLGFSTRLLPDVGSVRFLERRLTLSAGSVTVGAAQPLRAVEGAREGIAQAYVVAGGLALLVAIVASYLAGSRITAPLRRMAAVAARVDGGDLRPRITETADSGEEVRVLADSLNHMLDRLAAAFAGQRDFIADASHELRTPLTVIRGQLEVLAAYREPPAEEVARVERVVQAEVTRMARLVDDLLVLTAAEQADFLRVEPIDVPQFVTELWDGLSLIAERRFELGTLPEGVLDADPDRLAQALRNLGRNSIEHTEPGVGVVRLEVTPRGDALAFEVIDDGRGIPPQDRERVFERLYRTDRSRARAGTEGGGAGLGLAIVRAIAEAHGGTVLASAGPGGTGTRVELVLPGYRPRTAPARAAPARPAQRA